MFQIEIDVANLPLLREQGADEEAAKPLLIADTLRVAAPRLDLPRNPVAPDWTLTVEAAEPEAGFWSRRDPLQNLALGQAAAVRWRASPADEWTASAWRLNDIRRTPASAALSFVSPLRRLLAAPTLTGPVAALDETLAADDKAATTTPADLPDGWYCVGEEVVEAADGELSRGRLGTTAAEHGDGETLNDALYFSEENPFDLVRRILTDAGGADYIDDDDWDAERDEYAPASLVSGIECEAREVGEVVRDLMGAAATILFFDPFAADGDGRIRMRSLSPWKTSAAALNADNIDDTSKPSVRRLRGQQITRATLTGARAVWPDADTARLRVSQIDANAERDYDYKREHAVSPFWLQGDIADAKREAEFSARLLVNRYRDPPQLIGGVRVAADAADLRLGDVVSLEYPRLFLDNAGDARVVSAQVVGVQPSPTEGLDELTLMRYGLTTGAVEDIVIEEDEFDLNLYERFLRPTAAVSASVRVKSGAVLGATLASAPAFTTGALPAGSEVELIVEAGAYVVGFGGAGGRPAFDVQITDHSSRQLVPAGRYQGAAVASGDGGDAVEAAAGQLTINNAGVIGGGGGGGGGFALTYNAASIARNTALVAAPGGGGAGRLTGMTPAVLNWGAQLIVSPPAAGLTAGADAPRFGLGHSGRSSVFAGDGGDLGEDGQAARENYPAETSYGERFADLAAGVQAGGAAGAAVVKKSGATLVYAARGDLRGAAADE